MTRIQNWVQDWVRDDDVSFDRGADPTVKRVSNASHEVDPKGYSDMGSEGWSGMGLEGRSDMDL